MRVILRKPYCEINERNMAILQFLDLIKEVVDISEVEGEELTNRLFDYMKSKNIEFENMKPFCHIIQSVFTKICMRWGC